MKMKFRLLLFILSLLVLAAILILTLSSQKPEEAKAFDRNRAYQDVVAQTNLGPRTPGSPAHTAAIKYISAQLLDADWEVELQQTDAMGHPITNIIARRGSGAEWTILGAHYDSRLVADHDPDPLLAAQPVPGANDGASGVAVLLELARVLPEKPGQEIWLVFFDAEDQGKIEGWDWILGSRAFVSSLDHKPDVAVIIDMIGDTDLNVYREKNSDQANTEELWQIAKELGYGGKVIDAEKYNILDDHIPFLEAGIPAVDMIDFDYPHWHTSQDTADKVSPESLEIIGNILLRWLQN